MALYLTQDHSITQQQQSESIQLKVLGICHLQRAAPTMRHDGEMNEWG